VKLGGGRYRAATKVKVLSPEIDVIPVADAIPVVAGYILITVNLAKSDSHW